MKDFLKKVLPLFGAVLAVAGLWFAIAIFHGFNLSDGTLRNQYFDDGGIYVSEAIIHDNPSVVASDWYQEIQKNVTEQDLFNRFDHYGPRVDFLFRATDRPGWLTIVDIIAHKFNLSYQTAFTVSTLVFPLLLVIKYIGLAVIFFKNKRLGYLLPVLLLADFAQVFNHNFYWYVSSAYAYQFLSAALIIAILVPSKKKLSLKNLLIAVLMGISATMSAIAIPIAVVYLLHLGAQHFKVYQTVLLFVEKYYYAIAIVLFTIIAAAGLIRYLYAVRYDPAGASDALSVFNTALSNVYLPNIVLLIAAGSIFKVYPDRKMLILLMLVLSAAFTVFAGYLGIEDTLNTNRFVEYFYLISVLAIIEVAALEFKWNDLKIIQFVALSGFLLFTAFTAYFSATIWAVQPNTQFGTEDSPSLHEMNGVTYYLAGKPQQAYNYFMEEDYKRYPLILDVHDSNYSPEKVTADLAPQQ